MITRRTMIKSAALAAAVLPLAAPLVSAASLTSLSWQAFSTDENGFLRAPTLITGATEAVLVDAGFNYPDGQKVIDAIKASGKKLTTVYITANDPDYYFNLSMIHKAFPQAKLMAAPATVALMRKKAEGKVATWAPKLGNYGPTKVEDLVFPEASDIDNLTVDGEIIEIVNLPGTNDRSRYLWVPSLKAVIGGVAVFGGMYPWVADVPTLAERKAWIAVLDSIAARKPEVVVPGHMRADWPMDMSGIEFTRNYLVAFNEDDARTANAAELIAALTKRFPGYAFPISLELGAKVAKGEMKWG